MRRKTSLFQGCSTTLNVTKCVTRHRLIKQTKMKQSLGNCGGIRGINPVLFLGSHHLQGSNSVPHHTSSCFITCKRCKQIQYNTKNYNVF